MRVPILLVLTAALIASGCASMHIPVVQESETTPIDTTVSETAMDTAGLSEAEATYRPETLEWTGTPSSSFLPVPPTSKAYKLGFIVGLSLVGLSLLWALIFD
ncbi:MAG: hypothetical protein F4W92_09105 [Gammaproteobacteria bacterium]|nr:hypothetical protein [Gammaproteobacteria bacterium]